MAVEFGNYKLSDDIPKLLYDSELIVLTMDASNTKEQNSGGAESVIVLGHHSQPVS
jgi:hypothetical protein